LIRYQFERFHHNAATQAFALARQVIQFASTPNELYLSDCYRMEGRMFNESGEPTRAAESNRQAQHLASIAIAKGYIGPKDQRMPRILTGLGNSLSQLNHFDDALEAQLLAKKLCGDVPPEESDAITIIQLNLGFLLYRRGDLHNAEQILRATLEASPRTPPAMYALGNTLLAQGKAEDAIAVHLNGLEIYIEMFGDQHALVGRCAYKVGEILLLHKRDPRTARSVVICRAVHLGLPLVAVN
jgi:tetratricopeptide (TPR) repeat protein